MTYLKREKDLNRNLLEEELFPKALVTVIREMQTETTVR